MQHKPPAELIKFLKPFDPDVRDLAIELRSVLLDEMGPCYENMYDAYNAVAIGYGPSDRLSDGIFHIAVYAKHINLGFNHGATLQDPKRILRGSGKRIRHISFKSKADIARPEIRPYIRRAIKQALAGARKAGAAPTPKPHKVVSTVKAIYPKRRRPS